MILICIPPWLIKVSTLLCLSTICISSLRKFKKDVVSLFLIHYYLQTVLVSKENYQSFPEPIFISDIWGHSCLIFSPKEVRRIQMWCVHSSFQKTAKGCWRHNYRHWKGWFMQKLECFFRVECPRRDAYQRYGEGPHGGRQSLTHSTYDPATPPLRPLSHYRNYLSLLLDLHLAELFSFMSLV